MENQNTYIIVENDLGQSFRVPKQLVDVVITDYLVMVLFLPDEFPIYNLISLITHEPVQRLDDSVQVQTFGYWFDPILTLGTSVIVIGAFEDEAESFWYETNVPRFTPAKQEQSNLP